MGERTIYIKDLVLHILLKWKIILIFMLIFALLLNGFACFKSYQTVMTENAKVEQEFDETQYTSELTTEQINEVQQTVSVYKQYKEQFESIQSYCQNALKMQIDYKSTPTVNLIYKVQNCDNVPGLITYISKSVFTQTWKEDVAKELEWDNNQSTEVVDMISIKHITEESVSGSTTSSVVVEENTGTEVINIQVISIDKDSVKQLAELINEQIDVKMPIIQQEYASISMELINDNFAYEINRDLYNAQKGYIDSMKEISSAMATLTQNFDNNQNTYLNALLDADDTESSEEEVTETTSASIDFINIKYIFVGLVGGAFLACVYLLLVYVLSDKLHTSEEVKDSFEMTLLGEISTGENKYKGINAHIYRLFQKGKPKFTKEERMDMIFTGIKIAIEKGQMKTLHITGSSNSAEAKALKEELLKMLEDEDIQITDGRSPVYDPASLELLSVSDGVIFVDQIEESKVSDMAETLKICGNYDVSVIGAVVLA